MQDELARTRSKLQNELDDMTTNRNRLQSNVDNLGAELQSSREECVSLKSTLSKQSSSLTESDSQIRALKERIENLESTALAQQKTIESLETQIANLNEELSVAARKLQDGETLRRKLHNMVQELKGNIRVFCRVRPILSSEISDNVAPEQALRHLNVGVTADERDEICLTQCTESASGNAMSKSYPFTFDRVFDWNSSQKDVFDEISQLVQSALDGYRVCIFAYGQTGSGKTFTMEGDAERAGMIPRAVSQIFESTELLAEKGWAFSFEASYLEIYNETIRDLLASKVDTDAKYDIKHVEGKSYVTDLTVLPVGRPNEIMSLLKKAAANRAVAETQCNERSSRSHRLV